VYSGEKVGKQLRRGHRRHANTHPPRVARAIK
jgi:hypothetical protein